MAATAPRKTTARKAPAKKAQPRPAAEKIAAFDELRARAGGASLAAVVATPFVLGPDRGFDPPLVAEFPTDLELKIELEIASRRDDTLGILNILLGNEGFLRAIRAFKTEPDGDRLLIGLKNLLADHFLGRGAGDVPGGTPAS